MRRKSLLALGPGDTPLLFSLPRMSLRMLRSIILILLRYHRHFHFQVAIEHLKPRWLTPLLHNLVHHTFPALHNLILLVLRRLHPLLLPAIIDLQPYILPLLIRKHKLTTRLAARRLQNLVHHLARTRTLHKPRANFILGVHLVGGVLGQGGRGGQVGLNLMVVLRE